jgi:hypothetical protein
MRVRSVRRHTDLSASDALSRIAATLEEPHALLGGIAVFHGRVRGESFWFRTNAGPKVDWDMTIRGRVTPSVAGSEIDATVSTPHFGMAAAGLAVIVVLLGLVHAPQALIGPAGLILFLAVFLGVLDLIWHWHNPCDLLLRNLDGSLFTEAVPAETEDPNSSG